MLATGRLVKDNELSRNCVAERAGYSTKMIQEWQSGLPQNPRLASIVDVLNVMGYELVIQKIPAPKSETLDEIDTWNYLQMGP